MSKNNRALQRARRELASSTRVVKARTPADVATVIPYLLGFYPHESLVLVALVGEHQRVGATMRIDLVEPDEADQLVDYLCAVVAQHGIDQLVVAAFSAQPVVASAAVGPLLAAVAELGAHVVEAFRTDGRRWWSYTCHDADCCDPDGEPFDAGTAAIAADAVLAGLSRAESRDALRSCFDPAPEAVRREVGEAVAVEVERLRDLGSGPSAAVALRGELARMLGEPCVPARSLGRLIAAVQHVHLRDEVWTSMTRATASDHFELWRQAMCAAPRALAAPPGSLAGFAAWLSGRGALAWHACAWVAEVAPGYSMNNLLRQALDESVNPGVWDCRPERPGGVSSGGGAVAPPL